MAFDPRLVERVRAELAGRADVTERKMFGGVAFLLGDRMVCGVHGRELIVRLDPEDAAAALAEPNTREFDGSDEATRGWIVVQARGLVAPEMLTRWVRRALESAAEQAR